MDLRHIVIGITSNADELIALLDKASVSAMQLKRDLEELNNFRLEIETEEKRVAALEGGAQGQQIRGIDVVINPFRKGSK